MITDFLQSNRILQLAMDLQNSTSKNLNTGTIKPEINNLIIRDLYKPVSDCIAKEYLNKEQSAVITLLLMADIRSRLQNTKIDLQNPEYYIPLIYSDRELHEHVRNLLLKKDFAYISSLQDKINQIQIISSFVITEQGQPYQSYLITDIFDYLILDLQKYLIANKTVNECQCCHKLFLPKYRSTEKYCMFYHVDEYRTCREYMKRTATTAFQKERDKARGYQSNRIHNDSTLKQYDEEFLLQIYNDWSAECTDKYKKYNSNDDLDGFKDWIEKTKFTSTRLKELHEILQETISQRKKKNDPPTDSFSDQYII